MQRHTDLEKEMQTYLRYKAIFLNFFNGSQGISQSIEERKVDMFFITTAIVIPAIQLLTQNTNKELQRRVWNTSTTGHFCKKNFIVDVSLDCKNASQLALVTKDLYQSFFSKHFNII